MDVHRLRSVIDLVIAEHKRLETDQRLAKILQTLAECASEPSLSADDAYRKALGELETSLIGSRANDLVESERRILLAVGGEGLAGTGLARRVRAIAEERPFLPSQAHEATGKVAAEAQEFLESLTALQKSLRAMKIEPAELAEGAFELGILLPESAVTGDLGRVDQALQEWNRFVKELFVAVTGRPGDVRLRRYSAGAFELAIPVDQRASLVLGTIISGIYAMFRRINAHRQRVADLREHHYPEAVVGRVKDYEQQIIAQQLSAIREEARTKFGRKDDVRNKEIDKALDRALAFLAVRVRDGIDIELLGPPWAGAVATADGLAEGVADATHHVRAALAAAARRPRQAAAPEKPRQMQISQIASDLVEGERDEKPKRKERKERAA